MTIILTPTVRLYYIRINGKPTDQNVATATDNFKIESVVNILTDA